MFIKNLNSYAYIYHIYLYVAHVFVVIIYIYIYIYIYIFTNELSTSIHGTRKKQKTPVQEQEKNISRITVQRKKKEVFWGKKVMKRPTSSYSLKKIKGYKVSGQKKTKKPSANTAML